VQLDGPHSRSKKSGQNSVTSTVWEDNLEVQETGRIKENTLDIIWSEEKVFYIILRVYVA